MKRFLLLAAAQTLASVAPAAAAAPQPVPATLSVPGFGTIKVTKGTVAGQMGLPLGPLGEVVVTGSYHATDKFELCGRATGSWSPFATANLGLPKLTKLTIAKPALCVRRTKAGTPIELFFEGDLSAGGSGLHLKGTMTDGLAGAQFTVLGTANSDWNLKDVHGGLDKNTVTQQLALNNVEFIVTSQRIDLLTRADLPGWKQWRELGPGFHMNGGISLTPEARKASELARVIGAASALVPAAVGASTHSVPVHVTVTSARLQVDAGIPGKLRLKSPFAMAGNATWNFALAQASGLEFGATLPISYQFPSQKAPTTFVGQVKFKSPQTFEAALSAKGGMTFGSVTLDNITMQVGLDAVAFPTTGLPSSMGIRAKAHWAGAAWEVAGVAGSNPNALLLNAAIADASFDSILTKLPVSSTFKAAVPAIFKQLVVRKSELYFAPMDLTLGERAYTRGMGFTGDVDGPMGCRAGVSMYWEDSGVRAKVLWEGFKSEAIAKEIDQLVAGNTFGLAAADAKTFVAQFGLDTLVISVTAPTKGGTPRVIASWRARFKGKPYNGDFAVNARSITEVARAALTQIAKDWLDKKMRKLL